MPTEPALAFKTSLNLDLPPSCMQFCPIHSDYFVVGSYNLHQPDPPAKNDDQYLPVQQVQRRNGDLTVFRVDGDIMCVSVKTQSLSQPSAILDIRFHPDQAEHPGILAAITSRAELAVFCINPSPCPASPLRHLKTSRCQDLCGTVMFLQCSWHPVLRHTIAVTTSGGIARVLRLGQDWSILGFVDLDIRNSLEAWSIAWSPPATSAVDGHDHLFSVYCGGDDCLLRHVLWSTRCKSPRNSVIVKGHHNAGVTAILPLSVYDEDGGRLVVTGSYDDHLRVLAMDAANRPGGVRRARLICQKHLQGGVWRLILVDDVARGNGSRRIRILASCMHAGVSLVELVSDEGGFRWSCKITARFEEHQSMAYAADCVVTGNGNNLRCVSTSFYDKLLCLWEYSEQDSE